MPDLPNWVRLNLISVQSALLRLPDDSARGRWFLWMVQGATGQDAPSDDPVASAGHAFGRSLLTEAVAYQQQVSDQRRGAAKARWGDAAAMRPHAAALQTDAGAMQNDAQYSTVHNKTVPAAAVRGAPAAAAAAPMPGGSQPVAQASRQDEDLFPDGSQEGGKPLPAQDRTKRDPSPADLGVLFPALLVYPEDRQPLAIALVLYGPDAVMACLRKLSVEAKARPRGKHRILLGELTERLRRTVALASEDYQRAGLPVPDGTPSQTILDCMTPHNIQEMLRNA